MKDAIIVLSGGMDSTTLLYQYQDEIQMAVSFDYGSNHNQKEIDFAAYHCKQLQIEHLIIPLAFMKQYFKSSLLEGADAIPEGHYEDENMRSTVVPFRNGIMLAIAAGLAESHHLKRIFIANHNGDHAIYPDCRGSFVDAMNKAVQEGTYDKLQVVAPYTQLTKADIARVGKKLNIDYSKTWSCYKGNDLHCGKCGTCVERKEALAEAQIEDHTQYED